MCDTPVLHTQNGLGTGETDDYSPCFQLPGRGITGRSEVGHSGWTVPKGGMRDLQGEAPNMELKDNPWGHVEHCEANCTCLESDRTGAYVHCLLPGPGTLNSIPANDNEVSVEVENGFTFNNDCGYLGIGRPGSILFVSEKPGAYGRLLLAVYVRWKTGLLISSDWLRPVTRGAWRAVHPDRVCEPGKPIPVHGPGETR